MKKLLLLAILFISFTINAQVGIGTDMPNPSSQLEIVASNRGILIPQVALTSLTDETTITNGNVESLLVFNTSDSGNVTPGYYYWYAGSWKRITTTGQTNPNIPANNVVWNVENESFVYLNEEGEQITIELDDIANESITTLVDNTDGTYTYKSEDNTVTTINVPADVIGNISNNGVIYEEILTLLSENASSSNLVENGDGSFTFVNADGTEVLFDVNTTSFIDNGDGTYNLSNNDGDNITIDTNADALSYDNVNSGLTAVNVQEALDEIQNILANTTDKLIDNGNGTYTHTAVDGTEVIIDANTTSVSLENGLYTFTDGNGDVIASIDTNANAIAFDNTNNGFTSTNVQAAIEEVQSNLDDTDTGLDNINLTDNGDGTFTYTDSEGTPIDFDANTTSYSQDENGNYVFTNDNGESITVTVVDDVVTNIQEEGAIYTEILDILGEESDVLQDNGNGTYTHTAVDGTEMLIDANTTSASLENGVYTFTDANGDVIASIDTNANAIAFDNTENGFTATNVQGALEEIQSNLDNTDTGLDNINLTDNGDGTFTYTDSEGTPIDFDANTTSYSQDENGNYVFTNDNGESITVTVVDDVVTNIQEEGAIYTEILDILGEESDVLQDNGNGTYTHTAVDGTEMLIDANTTSVSLENGVYTFTDANGDVIASIDTNADAIAFDNTTNDFTATNVQAALEELLSELETGFGNLTIEDNEDGSFSLLGSDGTTILGTVSKSDLTDNTDGSYTFTNNDGTDATFDVLSVAVAYDTATGLYNFTDSNGDVIASIDTNADAIAFDNTTNDFTATNVQAALEELLSELETGFGNLTIEDNEDGSFSLLGADGTTVLGSVSKSDLTDNADGSYTFTNNDGTDVEFDVLSVAVAYDAATGLYNFTDANGDVIASIDTNADAIAFDNTTNDFTATNVQAALEELLSELETGFRNLTIEDNQDGSFSLLGADGTTLLGTVSKSNLTDGEDGSYTFTNNDGTDVEFDVLSVEVAYDSTAGIYNFTNSNGAVIAMIDTNANALNYDNTNSGLTSINVQDALDEIQNNLDNTTDKLVNNGDGTYTHTAVDGTVVEIDANTTSVSLTDGVYTFTDGNGDTITSIDTNANALAFDNSTNDFTADNVQDALEELLTELETGFGNLTIDDNGDGSFSLLGADETTILGTVTKSNLTDNADGSYTFTNNDGADVEFDVLSVEVAYDAGSGVYNFTNSNGAVIAAIDTNADALNYDNTNSGLTSINVQDALDEIQNNLDNTTDKLVNNGDGTYTHTAVDGTEVLIDANTTNVTELNGIYTFTDGNGDTITSIDTNANAIAFDNTTNGFAADNVQSALEELLNKLETGFGNLSIEDNEDGSFSLVGADGSTVLGAVSKSNLTDEGDGSYTFTNNDGTDVEFDVLSVEVAYDTVTGLYNFKDSNGFVIATINTNASALNYDNTTSGLTALTVQQALDEIQNNLDGAADGGITSTDLTVTDGENSTFKDVVLEITPGAVVTDKLAADAVTNAKLADNAVNTENIVDGGVGTLDLAVKSVTADKLNSGSATSGQVGIADGAGNVAYGNVSSGSIDGEDFTSSDLTITNGIGATLTAVTAEIKNGAVVTDKLAADAVTNAKLADDAVNTENIVDGGVGTSDLAASSVTADKLNSGSATSGQVGIADGAGNVTYGNITSGLVAGQDFTSSDLTITNGTGATLTAVTAEIKNGAVVTDKLAADAVTNAKLADDAINTENIVDGGVEALDINVNVAGGGLNKNTTTGALEVGANNGITATTNNIQLGGNLIQPTAITTDVANTLALEGLQSGSENDNILVANPNTGVLKQIKAAMPKFFYMPSIIIPTDASQVPAGQTFGEINLHQRYADQFGGGGLVNNPGTTTSLPILPANELDYYITWYDTNVFQNVSVSDSGVLTYDVLNNADVSVGSFMNIVFVVKP